MNAETVDNLTSAEAGFLYGAVALDEGDLDGWSVHEMAAEPLAAALEKSEESEAPPDLEGLEYGRVWRWWQRRSPIQPRGFRRAVARAFGWLESEGVPAAVRRRQARSTIDRAPAGAGRDLSALSPEVFDIRWWFEAGRARMVELRLVVLGAVVVGGLDRMAVRRRVASMLRDLPSSVRREVREGLAVLPELDREVARRVYEVYGRIAEQSFRPGEELALLGLFFVVSAAVFRQNSELDRLENTLSEPMRRRCRLYRRACLKSDKPELSPAIARTIQSVIAVRDARREQTDEQSRVTGEDDE